MLSRFKYILLALLLIPLVNAESLLSCSTDDDCPVPPNCVTYSAECSQNLCDYNTECSSVQLANFLLAVKADIQDGKINNYADSVEVQINPDTERDIAGTPFFYTKAKALKEKTECQVSSGEYLSNQKEGCFESSVNWGEVSEDVENKKKYDYGVFTLEFSHDTPYFFGNKCHKFYVGEFLEEACLDYNYEPLRGRDVKHTWKVGFENVFDLDFTQDQQVIELGEKELCFTIDNKFMDIPSGGYFIRNEKQARGTFGSEIITREIKTGVNEECISFDFDETGVTNVWIRPFFHISGEKYYYADEEIQFSYRAIVEGELSSIEVREYTSTPEPEQKSQWSLILGGLIFLAILAVIWKNV